MINSLIEMLGISQVIVVGFGAGAPVAFELAKNHPDKVTGLVLESIGQEPNDAFEYSLLTPLLSQPVLPNYLSYLLYLSTNVDFYSTAKFFLAQDTSLSGEPLRKRIRSVVARANQYRFLKKILRTTIPVSSRVAGILNDFLGTNYWEGPTFNPAGFTTPTVIVQARDDKNGYYSGARSVSSQIADSQLITIEESGHFIWLGPNTRDWQRQVMEFAEIHKPEGYFRPDRA